MRIFPPGENCEMSRKIEGFGDIRDDLATRKFNRLGFLLSEGSDVQIVSGTLRVLEIKDFRHFLFLKNHICMIQIVKILNAYLVNILLIGGRTIILRIRTVANSLLIRNISQKSANKVILIIQFAFVPACAIKLLSIDVNSGES